MAQRRVVQRALDGRGRLVRDEVKPYPWQLDIWPKWKAQGYRGTVAAPTGTGKTVGALLAVRQYLSERGLTQARVLVVVPTRALRLQWESTVAKYFPSLNKFVDVRTIQGVTRQDRERSAEQLLDVADDVKYGKTEVLIVDEAHLATATTFSRIFRVAANAVLALTATPTRASLDLAGAVIAEPKATDVAALDMTDVLVILPLTEAQMAELERNKLRIAKAMSATKRTHEDLTSIEKAVQARTLYLSTLPQRMDKAIEILRDSSLYPALVVCATVTQAEEMYARLVAEMPGLRVERYHTGQVVEARATYQQPRLGEMSSERVTEKRLRTREQADAVLDDFKLGKYDVLISVKMLRHGFDYPALRTVIAVSPEQTREFYYQVRGRVMRPHPARKRAYFLLADGTNQLRLLDYPAGKYEVYLGSMRLKPEQAEAFKQKPRKLDDFADSEQYGWDGQNVYRSMAYCVCGHPRDAHKGIKVEGLKRGVVGYCTRCMCIKYEPGRTIFTVNKELHDAVQTIFGQEEGVFGLSGRKLLYLETDPLDEANVNVGVVQLNEVPEFFRTDLPLKKKKPLASLPEREEEAGEPMRVGWE